MTDAQRNDVQVKKRSKKATTIAMEEIQDIIALSNDAVFSGAWSWPIKVHIASPHASNLSSGLQMQTISKCPICRGCYIFFLTLHS